MSVSFISIPFVSLKSTRKNMRKYQSIWVSVVTPHMVYINHDIWWLNLKFNI